jgi:DNA-binding NarL/FixJ family response regulator
MRLPSAVHREREGGSVTEGPVHDPVRVVVVDDSQDIREVLRLALERQPDFVVVAEAADGEAGAAAVNTHKPDLVLLDIAMPEMDGLQALQAIRHDTPEATVIMLTALPEEVAALSAVELRAHGYIRKGGSVSELLSQIREVLEVRAERS